MSRQLNIAWPRRSATVDIEIELFVALHLRHHEASAEELDARSEIVDWVKITYDSMLRLVGKGERGAVERQLDDVREAFDKASAAFGLALAETEMEMGHRQRRIVALNEDLQSLRATAEQREAAVKQSSEELQTARVALEERQEMLARLTADLEQCKTRSKWSATSMLSLRGR